MTSDHFKDGLITTYKNKCYQVPDKFTIIFETLSDKQYNGFKSLNDIVSRLGIIAEIPELKPIRIKNARKANTLTCSNCNNNYTNLVHNWISINERIVCVKCGDEIKKT
ncbi:hypothetical protein AM231_15400 [Paenibacillus solani]|uniref:Uncharacterized protein n=1 Tax=Paenibacillus solani TaxID=1705565 RepID=A0A0M1P7D1_9BACL|nr:hypothetical protein AM231_15400 [Paenibacillus solani]